VSRREWLVALLLMVIAAGALTAWGVLAEWDTSTALGVAGLGVSVAGFAIAILAIERTGTIAANTRDAIRRTLAGVAASRLGIVITQLRQSVIDLEEAAQSNDPRLGRATLNQWRHLAADAEGLVKRRFGAQHEGIALLSRSVRLAGEAKAALFEDGASVRIAITDAVPAMEQATDQLGPLLEELLPTGEEESDES